MTEREAYETRWHNCDRCKTRRPLDELGVLRVEESTRQAQDPADYAKTIDVSVRTNVYGCTDLGWCSKAAELRARGGSGAP